MGDIEDAYIPANIPGDYQIMMWTVAYKYCRIVNGRYESLWNPLFKRYFNV